MKTVKDLMEYLAQFEPNARVVKDTWIFGSDIPIQNDFPDEPYVETVREGPNGRRNFRIIHF